MVLHKNMVKVEFNEKKKDIIEIVVRCINVKMKIYKIVFGNKEHKIDKNKIRFLCLFICSNVICEAPSQ